MFPSKSEQRMAQRVLETLKKQPDSNAVQISDLMSPRKSPNAKIAESHGLYHILDGLRALGLVTCIIDNFSLSLENEAAASLIYGLQTKTHNPPTNAQARYVVFVCEKCGAATGTRSSQKSATCKTCNHRNNLGDEHEVLLRTNNAHELQSAIQQTKNQRGCNNQFYAKLALT